MSSALQSRIMAETAAWWESLAPPVPPPETAPPPEVPHASGQARVARRVHKPEVRQSLSAQAAVSKEWQRLRYSVCCDESAVEEWHDVRARHRSSGQKCHVGRIFDICVDKNRELAEGHPPRKRKGRVVFEGNYV